MVSTSKAIPVLHARTTSRPCWRPTSPFSGGNSLKTASGSARKLCLGSSRGVNSADVLNCRFSRLNDRAVLNGAVESSELAALVPGIMSSLPSCDWSFGSSERYPHDVIVRISHGSDPLRSALVTVADGLELFFLKFQGFEDTDFAYDDDRREVLSVVT